MLSVSASLVVAVPLITSGLPCGVGERFPLSTAVVDRACDDRVGEAKILLVLLNQYPSGRHRTLVAKRLFEIANGWLDVVRAEMTARRWMRERTPGSLWKCLSNCHVSKPFFRSEGQAVFLLEEVARLDPNGPFTEQALFLAGAVAFFRENYARADIVFSRLIELRPRGTHTAQAIELVLLSKRLCYDEARPNRCKLIEARELIAKARCDYPEMAERKNLFLTQQLIGIKINLAKCDFAFAERLDKLGFRAAAWWAYELVRVKYRGTYSEYKAEMRQKELYRKPGKSTGS